MENVDVVVIGSGQGGVPLAASLAKEGKDVVVFERGSWGGSCLNYGCTPSKMILASAHAASEARRADDLGIHATVEVDFPAVMDRIRRITGKWSQGVKERLTKAGVRLIEETAAFTAVRTVTGGGITVQAPLVVIDTGKSPLVPPIEGLEGVPYYTYKTIWGLEQLPPRTLIIGAGYVGVELGQALARLGSKIEILEIAERPVPGEEARVSEALAKALRDDGVTFSFDTRASEVSYDGDEFVVTAEGGRSFVGEVLLVAAGRKPNTEALQAQDSGIELDDKGHVEVDDQFHTTCEGVYAIGDVTGQPAFTHVAWEDYLRLTAILNGEDRSQRDRVLGYAFFTDPQVARAGLTKQEAEEEGYDARAVTMELKKVARAVETGQTQGFYRMVVDRESDRILGATLVAPQAGELIHVFIAHMEARSTWHTLAQSVHIHPTFAEGLRSLARMLKENDGS